MTFIKRHGFQLQNFKSNLWRFKNAVNLMAFIKGHEIGGNFFIPKFWASIRAANKTLIAPVPRASPLSLRDLLPLSLVGKLFHGDLLTHTQASPHQVLLLICLLHQDSLLICLLLFQLRRSRGLLPRRP